jgi:16S rRNA (cytosine967-C5)-methyltransferase
MRVSPARAAAFRILRRVEDRNAFADDLLRAAALADRDAALAEELVLGVLRRRGQLDCWIASLARRDPGKVDPEVRIALRLGLYQLGCLDRIPPHAAVAESVELVKRARKASAAALVNAVLRRAAASPVPPAPSPELALPAWLLDRWRRRYGPSADRLALATLEAPSTYLRLNPDFEPAETLQLLAAEGVETRPAGLPLAARVVRGSLHGSACLAQGRLRVQDLNSQRVVPLLELQPDHRFLDLCAAPGGKTLQALEYRPRLAVACDLHRRRLCNPSLPNRLVLDATRPLPFSGRFDRILVDVPCSGTGTLSRNPEIKWKLTPADLVDLAARQSAILRQALACLAPGGRLVYSTCSLEPEENEAIVSPFRPLEQHQWLPTEFPGDGFFAAVMTVVE